MRRRLQRELRELYCSDGVDAVAMSGGWNPGGAYKGSDSALRRARRAPSDDVTLPHTERGSRRNGIRWERTARPASHTGTGLARGRVIRGGGMESSVLGRAARARGVQITVQCGRARAAQGRSAR